MRMLPSLDSMSAALGALAARRRNQAATVHGGWKSVPFDARELAHAVERQRGPVLTGHPRGGLLGDGVEAVARRVRGDLAGALVEGPVGAQLERPHVDGHRALRPAAARIGDDVPERVRADERLVGARVHELVAIGPAGPVGEGDAAALVAAPVEGLQEEQLAVAVVVVGEHVEELRPERVELVLRELDALRMRVGGERRRVRGRVLEARARVAVRLDDLLRVGRDVQARAAHVVARRRVVAVARPPVVADLVADDAGAVEAPAVARAPADDPYPGQPAVLDDRPLSVMRWAMSRDTVWFAFHSARNWSSRSPPLDGV